MQTHLGCGWPSNHKDRLEQGETARMAFSKVRL